MEQREDGVTAVGGRALAAPDTATERVLAAMVGLTDVAMAYLGPGFTFVHVNEAYARSCRRSVAELVGRRHFDLFPSAENEAIFRRAWDTATTVSFRDKPFVFPDQPERGVTYWDWSLRPVPGRTGGTEGVVLSLSETTVRRRAEEEQRVFADLLAASSAAITIHACDGRFLYANDRALSLHGYTREEFLGLSVTDLDTPESAALIETRVREVLSRGEAAFDVVHRRKDGTELPMHVCAKATRWDGRDVVLSVAYDLTGQREAEQALRDAHRRLEEIGRRIPGIVYEFVRRPDGTYVTEYISESAVGILGLTMEVLKDPQRLFENVHPDDLGALWDSIRESERTRGAWRHDFRIRGADGEIRWMHGESTPSVQPDGGLRWDGILLDTTVRRAVEDALLESDERLRAFLDSSGDIVFMKDDRLSYCMVNEATARFFGRPREQLLGCDDFALMPRDAAETCRQGDRKALESGRLVVQTEEIGGQVFETSKFPIEMGEGRVGVGAIIRDVTEKRRMEDALRSSETRLRKVIEILPVGLWFADREGRLLGANAEGIRIWGAAPHVSPAEYGVFKAWRLPSGAPVEPDDWALARTIREGVAILGEELEIEAFDGRRRSILNYTAPIPDATGAVDGAVVVNLDVTDIKLLEEDRRQLLERFDLASRAAALGVWDWDVVADVLVWDEQMRNLYGVRPEDFAPRFAAWVERLHPEDRERGQAAVRDALEGRGEFDLEFRIVRGDGAFRHLRGIAKVTRDATGRPLRMTGVNYDITERKDAEARLYAQLGELKRWNEATLGREMRVLQLKHEVNELLVQAGHPPRYPAAEGG